MFCISHRDVWEIRGYLYAVAIFRNCIQNLIQIWMRARRGCRNVAGRMNLGKSPVNRRDSAIYGDYSMRIFTIYGSKGED